MAMLIQFISRQWHLSGYRRQTAALHSFLPSTFRIHLTRRTGWEFLYNAFSINVSNVSIMRANRELNSDTNASVLEGTE
jgi:hypothetical protein